MTTRNTCIPGMCNHDDVFEPPPRRTKLIWAAVDFDNTIAYSMWTPDNPSFEIGDPVPGSLRKCVQLAEAGYKIIVHTARPWADYELIEAWLDYHDYPWRRIECGKLLAEIYVDDRARHSEAESWLP